MNKNLLTRIGESIDQHREERRNQSLQLLPEGSRPRWTALIRWFLPNGGTLLLIAALIFTQNVWAGPTLRNLTAESAASTGTIAYQGRLADSSGNPLTSTLNMSFRLYNASTGGAPLWTEQWTGSNGVKVSDGLFNVMLGSLTPIAQSVITGNSTLFLGITVGTDDEMSPRVQLGSVPFAVQALTVPDGSITAAKIADGAVTKEKLAEQATGFVTGVRQNDTVNVTGSKTAILSGWGYFTGANSTSLGEFVQFGTPFAEKPIIVASYAAKYAGNGVPTDLSSAADFGSDNMGWIHHLEVRNITTSRFWVAMRAEEGHSFSSGAYYLYTWVAIGQVP